jgi:hypothetical protein
MAYENNIRIELAAGAEEIGLAVMLKDLMRQNLAEHPHKLPDFRKLNLSIGLTVSDAELALTMAFNETGLTIYPGIKGIPALDITVEAETVLIMSNVQIKWGLPYYFDEPGQAVLTAIRQGRLKIKGMLFHFPSLVRLSRVMSVH